MPLSSFCKLGVILFIGALVAACGGGGSTTGTGTATTTASTTTTTVPGSSTTLSGGTSITGVVATGSPLLGASIKIVDATGAALSFVDATGASVTSGTTSTTDGSYRVTLGANAAALPLMIEAAGRDAAGAPVVLHSKLASSSIPVMANITPATDAVVAMVLGANPLTVFQNAAASASSIALLGSTAAITAASDGLKAIIATNLSDSKVANSKTLDFFQDTSFSPNKTGLDAALEGLRIQVAKDANGKAQLQFSNKLLSAGTVEVKLDLATAKTELAKASGGSVANAIVSATKTTTSPTSTLANLGTLDNLSIAINKLIGAGKSFSSLECTDPLLAPNYTSNNSYLVDVLTTTLSGYAQKNYQIGRFQITGCADDPVSSKGCTRVIVSSVVTNAAGQIIDVLSDTVAYGKTTARTCPDPADATKTISVTDPNWTFVGNNLQSEARIYPAAYITFGLDGSPASTSPQNSGSGVQVNIVSAPHLLTTRQVLMPNGHVVTFKDCGNPDYQCIATDPAATPIRSGELKDSLLQQAVFGWMGNADTAIGAKYNISFVEFFTNAGIPVNAYLSAEVPSDLANAPFPKLDGVSSAKPLTAAAIAAGPTLSWAIWAAANPNLKIFLARTIIASATATPLIQDPATLATAINGTQLPAAVVPSGFVPLSYQVWLGAQDAVGRRYYSKYSSAP